MIGGGIYVCTVAKLSAWLPFLDRSGVLISGDILAELFKKILKILLIF